jgi:serine/threonine protein kinase
MDKEVKLDDEKLVRTYFHQLVEAVEHMHEKGMGHQDIKLDNLLLDNDFQLKVADFDLCWKEGDEEQSKGTINYRAPEVLLYENYEPQPADVFAMGIVLFAMHNGKIFPFLE